MAGAQTLGGHAAYNFLKLPASPLLTAAGGVNVSYQGQDVGMSSQNPALFNSRQHMQAQVGFNSFFSGIKTYALSGAYYHQEYETSFGAQIYFLDYGSLPQTDASGFENGTFRPVDFVVQVSAARSYMEKWNYGASLKFIRSAYGQYTSSALALDVGLHYEDSASGFSAGFLARNMGFQLSTYAGEAEDLPFDMQIGLTKRLTGAPFGFSFTANNLHRFNLQYNDTLFNQENELPNNDQFANRLLNHFVVASHIYLGDHIEATLGYNHLRRNELNAGNGANGLNGFSMGLRVKFSKLQVLYSRASYQKNLAYNHLGITLLTDKLFKPLAEL